MPSPTGCAHAGLSTRAGKPWTYKADPHRVAQPHLPRRGPLPRHLVRGCPPTAGRSRAVRCRAGHLAERGDDVSKRASNSSDYLLDRTGGVRRLWLSFHRDQGHRTKRHLPLLHLRGTPALRNEVLRRRTGYRPSPRRRGRPLALPAYEDTDLFVKAVAEAHERPSSAITP